jgi:hypothetical protein
MSIEQVSIDIPSDPALRLALKNGIDEIVSSMTRQASEKALVKDIVKTLKEKTGVPSKTLNRFAKWTFLGNRDKEVGMITEEEENYKILYGLNDEEQE